jgi:hypothetical protein
MYGTLIEKNIDFDKDTVRNIPSIVVSEDLLDDLSESSTDRKFGETAVDQSKTYDGVQSNIIMRPFSYGTAISDSSMARPITRFSDGSQFGVWYGSLDLETSVYETVFHWIVFIRNMLIQPDQEMIAERRVFNVHIAGILIDLRDKHTEYPALISPTDYTFTNRLGAYLYTHGQSGLLVKSARCKGINAAIFNPKVLSNVRHNKYIAYRWAPGSAEVLIEDPAGAPWFSLPAKSIPGV